MFIIHGKKLVRTPTGLIGQFCPFCRKVTLFDAVNVRQVDHIYFIPMGRGQPVVTEIGCRECAVPMAVTYDSVRPLPEAESDVRAFAAKTSPLGPEALAARLELEDRATRGKLTQQERDALIEESVRSLEYFTQLERSQASNRGMTAVITFLAVVAVLGGLILWYLYLLVLPPTTALYYTTIAFTVAAAIFLPAAIVGTAFKARRTNQSRPVLGHIARALGPLRPNLAETTRALDKLRAEGSTLAHGQQAETLLAAINNPDSSVVPLVRV